jgi:nucleoside-diphosphate-sugar epimerase
MLAITGSNGVIGRHLIAKLNILGMPYKPITKLDWDLKQWKDIKELDDICGEACAVLHCGALVPKPGLSANLQDLLLANVNACGALGLWAMDRKIPILYAGSAGVYAPTSIPAREDSPLSPTPLGGTYGLSKLLGERLLVGLVEQGLDLCVLRITSVYGAGMAPNKLVSRLLRSAQEGHSLAVTPPYNEYFNLVHASDVASAFIKALNANVRGVFNIGGSALVSVLDIAEACLRVAGKGRINDIPDVNQSIQPEVHHFNVDISKAQQTFGFEPAVDLQNGLRMLMENRLV